MKIHDEGLRAPLIERHSRERGNPGQTCAGEAAHRLYPSQQTQRGTLYTGVTSDLVRRVAEHKSGLVEGFTRKYGVHMLVYYERHNDMRSAIARAKQIRKWKRAWKVRLIESENPEWRDLAEESL